MASTAHRLAVAHCIQDSFRKQDFTIVKICVDPDQTLVTHAHYSVLSKFSAYFQVTTPDACDQDGTKTFVFRGADSQALDLAIQWMYMGKYVIKGNDSPLCPHLEVIKVAQHLKMPPALVKYASREFNESLARYDFLKIPLNYGAETQRAAAAAANSQVQSTPQTPPSRPSAAGLPLKGGFAPVLRILYSDLNLGIRVIRIKLCEEIAKMVTQPGGEERHRCHLSKYKMEFPCFTEEVMWAVTKIRTGENGN